MQGIAEDLPLGWASTTLGGICDKPEYGWTTKAANSGPGPKLLRTTDISKGVIDWSTVPVCTQVPPSLDKYLLKKEDIVVSRAGSVGLSALIGDCPEAVFASYLIRFRAHREISVEYLHYFLKSPSYWEQIAQESAGIALQNVNAKKLAALTVPLPPLPEQHRIVAEIEKQFTRLDASEAALRRVQANLKRYRASVLKAACEGKLVPTEAELAQDEGRDYEPADQLLERILTERRARWESQEKRKGKYKEPATLDTSDLPELPDGWAWATVDGLILKSPQNGIYKPKSQYGDGVPILRIEDYQDFHVKAYDQLQRLRITAEEASTYGLGANQLIINRVNSPSHLGKTLIIPDHFSPVVFESNMMRVVPSGSMVPSFLAHYLRSPEGRVRLTSHAKWAVNQASINQSDVCTTPVPVPPPAEQQRIVAEVERRLSITQQAEAAVGTSLRRVERLRQSILKQAFCGQLVPQGPNDEPAAALLERIRAERAATQAASSTRGKTRGRRRAKSTSDSQLSLLEGDL